MDLSEVRRGDLYGDTPDNWYERLACRGGKSKTFHWGFFVNPIIGKSGIIDWAVSDSVSKGITIDRLGNHPAHVYRIKNLPEPPLEDLIVLQSKYGDLSYSLEADFLTIFAGLVRIYLQKVFPVIHTKGINCIEWVCTYAMERGVQLVSPDEYPSPALLENSSLLEYLGEINV